MSPFAKRIYLSATCAAVGFFFFASLVPSGGARLTQGRWYGTLFGLSWYQWGALGAAIGIAVGFLAPAWMGRRSPAPTSPKGDAAPPLPKRRRWKAPKRFGKRGR